MRCTLPVAVIFLAGFQPQLVSAAASSVAIPVCAPTPKIISFGNEYQSRTPPPEGSVVVEVTIEVSGRVSAVRIVKSSDARLNKQALSDAEKWVFESPIAACRAQVPVQYRNQ
jgi:TonB family protein